MNFTTLHTCNILCSVAFKDMKLVFKIFLVIILSISHSYSDVNLNFLPGEGYTETSIDLRENNKPDFSILAVRELIKLDNGNYFTQFSIFNTEQNNDERIIGNLGFGRRTLNDDKTMMTGLNIFLDADDNNNARASIGAEARNAVLEFYANYYSGLSDGDDVEKVMDGYDLRLASQIPYLHWAKAFLNTYEWKGVARDDIEGMKLGSELLLTPNLNLELAFDDKDKTGLEDEWYAKIMFVHPAREGPTAIDGISDTMWKEEKDMSGELLSKVQRNNKIMIEFKGTSVISRTD